MFSILQNYIQNRPSAGRGLTTCCLPITHLLLSFHIILSVTDVLGPGLRLGTGLELWLIKFSRNDW